MNDDQVTKWHTELAEAIVLERNQFNKAVHDFGPDTSLERVKIAYFNALCLPLAIVLANGAQPTRYVVLKFAIGEMSITLDVSQKWSEQDRDEEKEALIFPIISEIGSPLLVETDRERLTARGLARHTVSRFASAPDHRVVWLTGDPETDDLLLR